MIPGMHASLKSFGGPTSIDSLDLRAYDPESKMALRQKQGAPDQRSQLNRPAIKHRPPTVGDGFPIDGCDRDLPEIQCLRAIIGVWQSLTGK